MSDFSLDVEHFNLREIVSTKETIHIHNHCRNARHHQRLPAPPPPPPPPLLFSLLSQSSLSFTLLLPSFFLSLFLSFFLCLPLSFFVSLFLSLSPSFFFYSFSLARSVSPLLVSFSTTTPPPPPALCWPVLSTQVPRY